MYSFVIVLQFDNTDKKTTGLTQKIVIFVVKPTRNVMAAMATSNTYFLKNENFRRDGQTATESFSP